MTAQSSAIADASKLLRAYLCLHLDQVELLASRWDEWSDDEISVVRDLIVDLVHPIRQLLREHIRKDGGECAACSSDWPCGVLTTIHAVVTDPERQFVPLVSRVEADS